MYRKPILCMPDKEKSCFACCPPIRATGYEHIQYKNIIKRMLRENTISFELKNRPITGFSCWALGYIDKDFKLVGCLLHPAQNNGVDLRRLTGYGEKCRRESCLEAKIFSCLEYRTALFWLQFTKGMDSFSYSSRTINPIFHILRWGKDVLEYIAKKENYSTLELDLIKEKYRFLKYKGNPREVAYIVKVMINKGNIATEEQLYQFIKEARKSYAHLSEEKGVYVHLIDMDKDFLDFVRLGLHIRKIRPEKAIIIKNDINQSINRMLKMSKSFYG